MNNNTNNNEIVSLDADVINEMIESFTRAAKSAWLMSKEFEKEEERFTKEGNNAAASLCFESQILFLSLCGSLNKAVKTAQKEEIR